MSLGVTTTSPHSRSHVGAGCYVVFMHSPPPPGTPGDADERADSLPDSQEPDSGDELSPAWGHPRAVAVRFRVPPDQHGKSAEEVLAHKVRRLGLPRARRVVLGGDLRVAGRPLLPDEPLARGTELVLWRKAPDAPDDPMPAPGVLFEGDGLIVLDKPADVAVHPSARYLHRTLTGWLRRRGSPANPCHRLDRETSGVIVCAHVLEAERRWKTAFAAGRVQKEYLAVVRGALKDSVVIDVPLALQGDRGLVRIRMRPDPAGLSARTDVEPVRVSGDRSLVLCRPRSGRQHQIRAHLAHLGYPIVGDKLYAMGDAWFDAFTRRALTTEEHAALEHPRQALHAARITLDDDGSTFAAPLPDELTALL